MEILFHVPLLITAKVPQVTPLTRFACRNPRGSPNSPSFVNSSTASGPPPL